MTYPAMIRHHPRGVITDIACTHIDFKCPVRADTVEKLQIFRPDKTTYVLTSPTNLTHGGDHISCDLFLRCHCRTLLSINNRSSWYFGFHQRNSPFKLSSFSTVSAHRSHWVQVPAYRTYAEAMLPGVCFEAIDRGGAGRMATRTG